MASLGAATAKNGGGGGWGRRGGEGGFPMAHARTVPIWEYPTPHPHGLRIKLLG